MSKMKKAIGLFLLITLSILLLGCHFLDSRVSYEKVEKYVNSNYEALETFPYDEMESYFDTAFVKKYLGRKTIVKYVGARGDNDEIIEFFCGGRGLATNSITTGFYYSKDDTPFAFEFEKECVFTETSPGVFEWENSDGSNKFFTQRIREHWFYYYMVWF